MNKNQETISLPKKSVHSLLNILHNFADLENELEDYLMFQDKELVKRLRKAKKDHLSGKVVSMEEFRKKYGLWSYFY